MPSGSWTKWLESDVRIRSRMTLDRRSNVTDFVVQLELWLHGKWTAVVRYDSAHGEAHVDHITPKGVTYEKVWLDLRSPFNEAFTLAEAELEEEYVEHISRFRRQMENR